MSNTRKPELGRGSKEPKLRLHWFRKGGDRKRIRIDQRSFTIGRETDCDLQVDDARVSRHHLRITIGEDVVTVQDLASRNGTRVNDYRLKPSQSIEIYHRDRIQIGANIFKVSLRERKSEEPITRSTRRGPTKTLVDSVIAELESLVAENETMVAEPSTPTVYPEHVGKVSKNAGTMTRQFDEAAEEVAEQANEEVAEEVAVSDASLHQPEPTEETATQEEVTAGGDEDQAKDKRNPTDQSDSQKEQGSKNEEQPTGPGRLPEHFKERLRKATSQHAADAALKRHFNRR